MGEFREKLIIEPELDTKSIDEFQSKMNKYTDSLKSKVDNLFDDVSTSDVANRLKKDFDEISNHVDEVRKALNYAIGQKNLEDVTKYTAELEKMQIAIKDVSDAYKYANKNGVKGADYYNQVKDMGSLQAKLQKDVERAYSAGGRLDLAAQKEAEKQAAKEAAAQAKEAASKMKVLETSSASTVKGMTSAFRKLGSIIKESFVDSLKVGATAVKKYFGLLGKSAKGIFNLIKKGFTGGSNSESSNPLVSLLKKGVTFYGIKKLIGDLNDFIAKTREMGGVAWSAFSEYDGHLAAIKENLRTIGTVGAVGLIQALTPVLNVLNYITQAAANAAMALASLFGFGDTVKSVISGYEQTADAIGGVGSAAKEAKMDLQSFDKLNNNASDQGGGGGGGAAKAIKALPKDPKNIKWLEELFTLMNNGEWEKAGSHVAKGINTVVKSLYGLLKDPKITKGMSSFNDALTDFLKGLLDIDTTMIGRTLGAGINLITFYINDLYNQLNQKNVLKDTGKKIADFFNGLFDEVDWTALGQALVTGARTAFDVFSGFIEQAQNTDLATKAGTAIKELLLGSIDRLFGSGGAEEIGKSIGGLINLAFDFIHGAIGDGETNKKIFEAIKTTITTAIQNVDASKMKDAAVDIANLIGDLLNTAADTINDNTGAISDAVAGTVNGLADSGALSNIAKGVTGFFLALANLMGQTVKKIDWLEVGSSILEGIGDAISDNPEGLKYLLEGFAVLFGVKLLAKIASIKASTKILTDAIGSAIGSSLGTAVSSNATATTVAGGLSSLFASPVITAAVTAAAAAMGVSVADTFVAAITDKLDEIEFNKKLNEKADLTSAFDTNSTSVLGFADSLNKADAAYRNLSGSADDLKEYLNELELAGFGGTEQFKKLKEAVDKADDSWMDAFSNSDLRKAYKEAGEFENQIWSLKNTLSDIPDLTVQEAQAVYDEMKKLRDGAVLTPEQAKAIVENYRQQGNNVGKAYVDGQVNFLNTDKSTQNTLVTKANSEGKALVEKAIEYSKKTGALGIDEYNQIITKDTTTGTTLLNFEGKNYKTISTKAIEDYRKLGFLTDDEYAKAIDANENLILSASINSVKNASDGTKETAKQNGETIGKNYIDGELGGINSKKVESIDAIKSSATLSDNDKTELYNQSKDVGKHTVGGIMAGIEEKKPELSNALSVMSQLIPSSLRKLLKINSPSKIMEEDVGQWVTLGLVEGITDETGAVTSAMADIQDAMMSSFDTNDMSKYFDFSGVPRSIAISPEVQKAQMQSILAQNQSTAGFGSALSALNHQLNKGNGNNMRVDVYLDANNKLGEFVINTVNGQIVKSGGF